MRVAWLTDIHLNFLTDKKLGAFMDEVAAVKPDAIFLGGDIDEAPHVASQLERLARAWRVPIYFVLGNHDFYRGSIDTVRGLIRDLCARVPNLTYLNTAGSIRLTDRTTLVGIDGWGDGGYGNPESTSIRLNDFSLIIEFAFARGAAERLAIMRRLGMEAAEQLRLGLSGVQTPELIVLTHVPPFEESAWHEGRQSDNDWLPFFACKATGDVLLEEMRHLHPERHMLLLCGHTHGSGECRVVPNLQVLTGGAEYGRPAIQRVIEIT